jgi:hypothetical protein
MAQRLQSLEGTLAAIRLATCCAFVLIGGWCGVVCAQLCQRDVAHRQQPRPRSPRTLDCFCVLAVSACSSCVAYLILPRSLSPALFSCCCVPLHCGFRLRGSCSHFDPQLPFMNLNFNHPTIEVWEKDNVYQASLPPISFVLSACIVLPSPRSPATNLPARIDYLLVAPSVARFSFVGFFCLLC